MYSCVGDAPAWETIVSLGMSFTNAMLLSYGKPQVLQTPFNYVELSDIKLV